MARTILIVDDEADVRDTLQRFIQPEGYDVIQAEGGEQGIALASKSQIDAFLVDIEMPRMNGIDFCRAMRAMDRYKATPIIFLTGHNDDTVLEEAFTSGGNDFVNKPCTVTVLRARLKSHLQRMECLQRLERMRRVLKQYLSNRTLEVVEDISATGVLPPPEEKELTFSAYGHQGTDVCGVD